MNRKYKLDTAGCTNKQKAVEILLPWCGSLEVANTSFEKKELFADPEAEGYREMIEDLDSIGVSVFDYERIQMPKFTGINHEPEFSYT